MIHVLLVADTHLGPGRADVFVDRISRLLAEADVILHAGDVTDASLLEALAEFAPVHAVLGNNDRNLSLPVQLTVRLDGCEVAMVHDSGPTAGRAERLRRRFPDADVVVFGHSHVPWNVTHVRDADGHRQYHVNPGSAIQRRGQPHCTAALIELDSGRVGGVTHVRVDA